MAATIKVVSSTLPTTNTGTVDLTSSGFGTPDAALIFTSNANTTNNPDADASFSVGFWDGTTARGASFWSLDAQTTTDTGRMNDTNQLIAGEDRFGTNEYLYSVSNITDGIRITRDQGSGSEARYVTAILLTGLTNAENGNYDLGTSTSAQSITTTFKPDVVFAVMIGQANPDAQSTNANLGFGIAHNSSTDTVTQAATSLYYRDNQTTTDNNQFTTNSHLCVQVLSAFATLDITASNFTTSSFDVTCSTNPNGKDLHWMALELEDPDDFYLTVIDAATSTGTQATTGAGFQPGFLGLISQGLTTLDSITAGGQQGYGFTDGTTHAAYFYHDEDGVTTSNSNTEYSSSEVLHVTDDAGTDDFIATLTSLDSDGWTLNYSDAAAGASKIIAFAFGDASGGGGGTTLTPGDGSVTVTGQAANVDLDTPLSIEDGSVTVTGQSVTAQTNHLPAPADGSITIAGQDATVTGIAPIEPGAGSVTASGQAATVETNDLPAPSADTISIDGQTAAVDGNRDVDPADGSASVAGQVATVQTNDLPAPSAGSLTTTGQAVSVGASGALEVDAATTSIVGQGVTLVNPITLAITEGTIVTAGQSLSVVRDLNFTVSEGALSITGQPATAVVSVEMTPTTASFAIAGQVVTIAVDANILPENASLAIAGDEVSLLAAVEIAAGQASLAIAGQALVADFNRGIVPDAATITVNGQTVTVSAVFVERSGEGLLVVPLVRDIVQPLIRGN